MATHYFCHVKILFVANRVPYPPYRGDKLKIWNLANRMKDRHELHLITIAQSAEDLKYREELEQVFAKVWILHLPKWVSAINTMCGVFRREPFQVAYFRSARFTRLLKDVLQSQQYGAIHVQHLRMARYFGDRPADHAVLDLPDAFSLYWKRRSENAASWWMRRFAGIEYKRLLAYEKQVLPTFRLNLVCSPEDRDYLIGLTGASIKVLPNGVDTSVFHPRAGQAFEKGRILFTGNMDYEPNVDAVEYFCKELLPLILKDHPGARFVIAGQRPVQRVLRLASEHVEITGFVPDMADEYAKADVVVAPLRFGAGTQNKVLESLAMGVPVVCSRVGFKGLGIESGQGAVLAPDGMEFARIVSKVLSDPTYRESLAGSGGDVIRTLYGWDAVAKRLEEYLGSVAQGKP